jgi:tetratricopeptide (TPR) repeat protein
MVLLAAGRQNPAVAIERFREAAATAPGYAEAHIELASALRAANRYGEAVESLRRALNADPERADARYEMGLAYESMGDARRAAEQFEIAARMAPCMAYDRRRK